MKNDVSSYVLFSFRPFEGFRQIVPPHLHCPAIRMSSIPSENRLSYALRKPSCLLSLRNEWQRGVSPPQGGSHKVTFSKNTGESAKKVVRVDGNTSKLFFERFQCLCMNLRANFCCS